MTKINLTASVSLNTQRIKWSDKSLEMAIL